MSTIAGTLDTHKDREVRHALEPLARLADKTGCAVLGNAHFNKSSGSDPLTLVTGSAAFGNVARAALGFARDPEAEDGSCVISQIKNNLGRLDLPSLRYGIQPATVDTDEGPAEVGRLVMLGETDRTVHDILRDRHDDDDRAERDEAGEWLQAYLVHSNGEAPAADVFKAGAVAGYSRDQLKRAKRRVGVDTRKTDMRGGWVWTLGPEWLAGSREGSTQGSEESRPQELHPSHPWCSLRRAIPSAARSADTSWRRSSERPG